MVAGALPLAFGLVEVAVVCWVLLVGCPADTFFKVVPAFVEAFACSPNDSEEDKESDDDEEEAEVFFCLGGAAFLALCGPAGVLLTAL